MQQLTKTSVLEIHNLIENRIFKAPEIIKKEFGFTYKKHKVIIEQIKDTILILLLSPNDIRELKWRQKKGLPKFPALITQEQKQVAFYCQQVTNFFVQSAKLQDIIAFGVGPECSIVIEALHMEINVAKIGKIEYKIDLGFIIRPSTSHSLYSIPEILDDLVVYYIKKAREAACHD